MTTPPSATLQTITDAALDATSASYAWLLAAEADSLVAVASAGPEPYRSLGQVIVAGSAEYVFSSGQAVALQPRRDDRGPWSSEHPLTGRVPASILSVPCETDLGPVGVLELLDKAGGPFTFDDVEVVTLLGAIAGAALREGLRYAPGVPGPEELGKKLATAFSDDPARYARVAVAVEALLAGG